MSVLHVFHTPEFNQAQIKFFHYKFCTLAPIVIYADFESILEPLGCQVKKTTYSQQHKVSAAAAFFCSTIGKYNQLTVTNVCEDAFT